MKVLKTIGKVCAAAEIIWLAVLAMAWCGDVYVKIINTDGWLEQCLTFTGAWKMMIAELKKSLKNFYKAINGQFMAMD